MSKSTYTKRDFDSYCKDRGVKQLALYSYTDSNGQECLTTINEEADYHAQILQIQRFIRQSEESADEVKKLVARQKKQRGQRETSR
jgi:hypothetical protein